jgi:thiol:disulfide interchange protein
MAGELALALVAGVLLNLTPCVMPAIPVKIRTIVHEAGQRPRQRIGAAAAFAAGTLLFFLGLAIATTALHWTWGALFQSRIVLGVLIAVLLAFAYTTYRDVNIGVPRFAYTLRGRRYVEPFLSGLFSALLATPCTGPFLGGVLAFSVTRPPAVIIAIFCAVGLGLALPYIILLLRPGLLDRLPKPGAWTVRVRQGLAFVLLAAAVFFAQSLVPAAFGRWLWFGWLALLIVWAAYALLFSTGAVAKGVAPAFAVAGVLFVYTGGLVTTSASAPLNWRPLSAANWQQAQSSRRPVLVEYTADWCINCKVLERTVYADSHVIRAVHTADMITLQANLTRPVSRLEKLLEQYGGAGLPLAVVLDGRGRVIARFSGLFTASALIQAIDQSTGEQST